MKKWAIIFSIGIWSCGDSVDDFGSPDQILLLSDREIVCPGQTATLRLFSTVSNQEIPISEFVFDPLSADLGSITSTGLYTAPSSFKSSRIDVSGTFKSKTKLSLKINTSNGSSSSQAGLEITPFDFVNLDEKYNFFHLDELRPYQFWPDGSTVFGTARILPESIKKFEIAKYSGQGVLQWKKDLGTGEAKFIEIQNDKIYVAGQLSDIGGAVFNVVYIYDLDGNVVWEKKIPTTLQHVFFGFQVDTQGYFYISTYTNGNSFVTNLEKYDTQGKQVWEVDPGKGFKEIFIFPDGNFVAKSEEGLGLVPFLTFFNSTGQLLKKGIPPTNCILMCFAL